MCSILAQGDRISRYICCDLSNAVTGNVSFLSHTIVDDIVGSVQSGGYVSAWILGEGDYCRYQAYFVGNLG